MNNSHRNRQDEKFDRKLNHLQGFIGLPNWDFDSPSFDDLKKYEHCGRKLQSKAFHTITKSLISKTFKVIAKISHLIRNAYMSGIH